MSAPTTAHQGPAAINVSVQQERLPAQHPSHGTPDPMVRRWIVIELPAGRVEVEQTDYGHPGRLNPPQFRRLPSALAPQTTHIEALVTALGDLLP